jgi:regulator of protease activity HflC (stomatin/prohibitin superfamily)
MFQTYRKGEEEIRSVVVRKALRNALNKVAGSMPIEYVYGEGKGKMIDTVQTIITKELEPTGIVVDKIDLIGSIRIPATVKAALDAKVEATQLAQKAENEVQTATARAQIAVAEAKGRSESVLVEAEAQAEANKLLTQSITPALIQYRSIEKWDGKLPTVTGGSIPFINMNLGASATK